MKIEHEDYGLKRMETGLGEVSMAGRIRKRGRKMEVYRYLGSYAVVQVLDGGGWYEDERGYRAKVGRGDVMMISPDVGHRYGPDGDGLWEEFYLVFGGPVFDLWRESGLLRSGLWRDRDGDLSEWGRGLSGVARSHRDEPLRLVCELQVKLAGLRRFDREDEGLLVKDEWCVAAMKLLGRTDLGLRAVAGEVGMGYEHFRKQFKRLVGVSPSQYRQKQVASRAWHLLAGSDKPVNAVAEQLGFCDEYYFSRFFKKQFGVTPSEIRK